MKIEVFGTQQCAVCRQVEEFLTTNNMGYGYKSVGKDIDVSELEQRIGHPIKHVPLILVDDISVSFDSLKTRVLMVDGLDDLEL